MSLKVTIDFEYGFEYYNRVIVTLSGGKASAWCANWAFKNFPKNDIILYFNDTKWENSDLYRFLRDLELYFNHNILYDSDGRNPEQLFYDNRALANNRMPFCSRILKAERLQKFYRHNDILIFGIGIDEIERANRLDDVYQIVSYKKNKKAKLYFPLIENNVSNIEIDEFLKYINVEEPVLYKLGFKHNNCSGGCVRAGKKHWKLLYEKLPIIYLKREQTEEKIRKYLNKDVSYFKDETLKHFRKRIKNKQLSKYYYTEIHETETECMGICDTIG